MSDLEKSIDEIYKYYTSRVSPELKKLLKSSSADKFVLLVADNKSKLNLAHGKICELKKLDPANFDPIELPLGCVKNGKNEEYYEKYIEMFLLSEHHMQPLMAADVNNLGCAYAWSNQYQLARETFGRALRCVGTKKAFDTIESNLKLIPENHPLPLPFPSIDAESNKLRAHLDKLHEAALDAANLKVDLLR